MKIDFLDIVKAELIAHDIVLCAGCDRYNSHRRGFAMADARTIHYNAKFATRKTLHGFLHEVGHVVSNHGKACALRRYQREAEAEDYARKSLRLYGIPVPRSAVVLGNAYVRRMKQFGDNIKKGRNTIKKEVVYGQ